MSGRAPRTTPGTRTTEDRLPGTEGIESLPLEQALALFDAEDRRVVQAVERARPEIARAVEMAAGRLRRGGRLLYVGAGTSGRLGVLDAAECPPTFGSDPRSVQGLIAGGPQALVAAVEGAEDSRELGRAAIDERKTGPNDLVLGISASGRTPFVHAALGRARELGAATVLLTCVEPGEVGAEDAQGRDREAADLVIHVPTGAEVIAGSTRLKAGTATKLVLNRISTMTMVHLGRTHGGRMIEIDARANAKLAERAAALVSELAGASPERSRNALEQAGGSVKVATLMLALELSRDEARARLEKSGGSLEEALRGERSPR